MLNPWLNNLIKLPELNSSSLWQNDSLRHI
uniref:Uncharacterized protein n=1 Tax=Anguilla anguilla TaxID=7936 RepID=A0A0E9U5Y5_ANGAN